MVSVMRYSCIASTGGLPAAILPPVSGVDFNGFQSGFTVGGWIRIRHPPAPHPGHGVWYQTVFSQVDLGGTNFAIDCDEGGRLVCGFAGSGLRVSSGSSADDGYWHFVAVSYEPGGDGRGALNLYLDGLRVDHVDHAIQQHRPPGNFAPGMYLGTAFGSSALDNLDFAAWMFWSSAEQDDVMDIPWNMPAQGTRSAEGLVAAFDFAKGEPPHGTLVGASYWNTPCVPMSGGTAWQLPLETLPLDPAGQAPFTVMGWIGLLMDTPTDAPLMLAGFANGTHLKFGLRVVMTGDKPVLHAYVEDGDVILENAVTAAPGGSGTTWTHVAMTFDGTQCLLIVNRSIVGNWHPPSAEARTLAALRLGGGQDHPQAAYWLQNVSFWSDRLYPSEIIQTSTDFDALDDPRCHAQFPFIADATELKTGYDLNVDVIELRTPFDPTDTAVEGAPPNPGSSGPDAPPSLVTDLLGELVGLLGEVLFVSLGPQSVKTIVNYLSPVGQAVVTALRQSLSLSRLLPSNPTTDQVHGVDVLTTVVQVLQALKHVQRLYGVIRRMLSSMSWWDYYWAMVKINLQCVLLVGLAIPGVDIPAGLMTVAMYAYLANRCYARFQRIQAILARIPA